MKRLYFLMLLGLFACDRKTAVPKDVIPVPQMTAVMWDLMLADGLAVGRYPLDSLKRFDTSVILYHQIAKAHNTNQQQLKRSMQFYESRPDLLQIIIDTLQQRSMQPLSGSKKDTTKKTLPLLKRPAI